MQYVNTSNGKTYTVEDWYLEARRLGIELNIATQEFETFHGLRGSH